MMEFYLREYSSHETCLQKYDDYSRKVVALLKKNGAAILGKAYPTSKQCIKFTLQSQLEVKLEQIPLLINTLKNVFSNTCEQSFFVIASHENYKKERIRFVYRTSKYGGGEILHQKQINEVPDEDLVFDDEATSCCEEQQPKKSETWDDVWGCFYLKKTDNLRDFVDGLNQFYHAAIGNATGGV